MNPFGKNHKNLAITTPGESRQDLFTSQSRPGPARPPIPSAGPDRVTCPGNHQAIVLQHRLHKTHLGYRRMRVVVEQQAQCRAVVARFIQLLAGRPYAHFRQSGQR